MAFISWVIILIGFISPVVLYRYRNKSLLATLFFSLSPLSTLGLVTSGSIMNEYILNDMPAFGYVIYILCISEVTLLVLYLMYYACIRGIAFISAENEWSKLGPKHELFIIIIIMISLLLMPHVAFGMTYSLWGILVVGGFTLSLGDSIFFSFSIIYSLPLSGALSKIQELISSETALRFVQVLHVVVAKIIEFIVIGFIIGKVASVIQNKLISRS